MSDSALGSPLGSPISPQHGPDKAKSPPQDKSGELKGRDVSPLSSESAAGSPIGQKAGKIDQTSKRELEKTPQKSSSDKSHQFDAPTEEEIDFITRTIDEVADQLLALPGEKETKELEFYTQNIITESEDLQELEAACQKMGISLKEFRDEKGQSLLFLAITAKNPGYAKALVEAGIPLDTPNSDGKTAFEATLDLMIPTKGHDATPYLELALHHVDSKGDTSSMRKEHWEALLAFCLNTYSIEDLGDLDVTFPKITLQNALPNMLKKGDWHAIEKLVHLGLDVNTAAEGQPLLLHAYADAKNRETFDFLFALLNRSATNLLSPNECRWVIDHLKGKEVPQVLFEKALLDTIAKAKWDDVFSRIEQGARPEAKYGNESLLNHAYLYATKTGDFGPFLKLLDMTKNTLKLADCVEQLMRLGAAGKAEQAPISLIQIVFQQLPIDAIVARDNPHWNSIIDAYFAKSLAHIKSANPPPEALSRLFAIYLEEKRLTLIKPLIQLGFDVQKLPSEQQKTLLKEIIEGTYSVATLRKAGVRFSQEILDKALFSYVQSDTSYFTQRVLLLGANIDVKDSMSNTALHQAIKNKEMGQVLTLMRFGANPLAANRDDETPLSLSSQLPEQQRREFFQLHTRLKTRFEAIRSDPIISKKGLQEAELRKLAYMIEVIMPIISSTAQETINKIPKEMHGLEHSLLYRVDPSQKTMREVHLLLKKSGDIKGSGTSKKASEAIKLPLKLNGETADRLAHVITKSTLSEHALQEVAKEVALHEELKEMLWPIYRVYDYTQMIAGKPVHRIALLMPPGQSISATPFTLEGLISASLQLADCLAKMHAKGYVHGDFKGENALATGEMVRPIDVGFTHKPESPPSFDIFSFGYYGSIFCTAPELFGTRKFSGDRKKCDVFAFGDMLYRKHFSNNKAFLEATPWTKLLMKYREKFTTEVVSEEDKAAFRTLLKTHVVNPYNALKAKSSLTPQEQFELVIYQALLPDPNMRPSMQQLCDALSRINISKQ